MRKVTQTLQQLIKIGQKPKLNRLNYINCNGFHKQNYLQIQKNIQFKPKFAMLTQSELKNLEDQIDKKQKQLAEMAQQNENFDDIQIQIDKIIELKQQYYEQDIYVLIQEDWLSKAKIYMDMGDQKNGNYYYEKIIDTIYEDKYFELDEMNDIIKEQLAIKADALIQYAKNNENQFSLEKQAEIYQQSKIILNKIDPFGFVNSICSTNLSFVYQNLGQYYKQMQELKEAGKIYEKLIEKAQEENQKISYKAYLSYVEQQIGNTWLSIGDKQQGFQYLKKAWEFWQQIDPNINNVQNQNLVCDLGKTYIQSGDIQNGMALLYAIKEKQNPVSQQNIDIYFIASSEIAKAALQLKDLQNSEKITDELLGLSEKFQVDKQKLIQPLISKAHILLEQQKNEESLVYVQKCYDILSQISGQNQQINMEIQKIESQININQKLYQQAFEIAKKIKNQAEQLYGHEHDLVSESLYLMGISIIQQSKEKNETSELQQGIKYIKEGLQLLQKNPLKSNQYEQQIGKLIEDLKELKQFQECIVLYQFYGEFKISQVKSFYKDINSQNEEIQKIKQQVEKTVEKLQQLQKNN
ncbi:hypothetical protein PPERSA_06340 [Pseudocohnilembus persalinus]|uniref:Uncharacterized protein n=1 Tax=Pseudocohnilembus persalinus TaxID=266149 RepID=A0A0V0QIL3_PSEPJ|nr:hypothetical protein PPERSA_06340 [Pseudocohnilembus persalinus]|eukprot:KRX02145.1 hypothetical protein PPERSA_06340 [Pseudocohnilembus persalinus]